MGSLYHAAPDSADILFYFLYELLIAVRIHLYLFLWAAKGACLGTGSVQGC